MAFAIQGLGRSRQQACGPVKKDKGRRAGVFENGSGAEKKLPGWKRGLFAFSAQECVEVAILVILTSKQQQ
jgi:hypothetical protein